MGLFDYLFRRQPKTAAVARERLRIVLAHERAHRDAPDCLASLQREILEVVERYFLIEPDAVRVHLERHANYASLELNIDLPIGTPAAAGRVA